MPLTSNQIYYLLMLHAAGLPVGDLIAGLSAVGNSTSAPKTVGPIDPATFMPMTGGWRGGASQEPGASTALDSPPSNQQAGTAPAPQSTGSVTTPSAASPSESRGSALLSAQIGIGHLLKALGILTPDGGLDWPGILSATAAGLSAFQPQGVPQVRHAPRFSPHPMTLPAPDLIGAPMPVTLPRIRGWLGREMRG